MKFLAQNVSSIFPERKLSAPRFRLFACGARANYENVSFSPHRPGSHGDLVRKHSNRSRRVFRAAWALSNSRFLFGAPINTSACQSRAAYAPVGDDLPLIGVIPAQYTENEAACVGKRCPDYSVNLVIDATARMLLFTRSSFGHPERRMVDCLTKRTAFL